MDVPTKCPRVAARSLPATAGVYRFRDAVGRALYLGPGRQPAQAGHVLLGEPW